MQIILNNFLAFGNNVVVDIPPGVTLVRGDNGVGKSGLLEGVTYAVWGKARGTSEFPGGDHLIRDLTGDMSVSVQFPLPQQIKLTRGRGNNTTNLDINVCGANQQFVTLDAGEKLINDIVGMGYDTFIKTAYFQQGKDKAFSELTSTESRKKVVEMLGLDRWQEKQAIASQRLLEIKQQALKYKTSIDNIDSKDLTTKIEQALCDIKDTHIKINILILETEIAKNILANVQTNAQGALEEERLSNLSKIKVEIEEYTQKMWNIRKQLKGYVDRRIAIDKEVDSINNQINSINIKDILNKQEKDTALLVSYRAVFINKKEGLTGLITRIDFLKKQIDTLSTCGDMCPILSVKCEALCGDRLQPRIVAMKNEHDQLFAEIISIRHDIDELQSKVILYENNISNYVNIKSSYDSLCGKISPLVVECNNINELMESAQANVNNIDTLMNNANIKHASISIELMQIKEGASIIIGLRDQHIKLLIDIASFQADLKSKEDQNNKLQGIVSSNETMIRVNTEKLAELEKITKLYNECVNEQCVYDVLVSAFGPNGVPAMQIEAMKDQIEVFANNILQYGGQKVSIAILLKEPKKSGEGTKDVFKILVKKGDKILPLFRFSGGEAYWIDLSIRAALFLVWRVRNPDNILDILMIDEGIGKIDDGKRRILIDVLKYLSTKIKRILIITHSDLKNLVDEFDNVITIKKVNDVSII